MPLHAADARQRRYAHYFAGGLFAPELVVDGCQALVGSDARGALAAIHRAHPGQHVALALNVTPGGVDIVAGTGKGHADLFLFGYDPGHSTAIGPRRERRPCTA